MFIKFEIMTPFLFFYQVDTSYAEFEWFHLLPIVYFLMLATITVVGIILVYRVLKFLKKATDYLDYKMKDKV